MIWIFSGGIASHKWLNTNQLLIKVVLQKEAQVVDVETFSNFKSKVHFFHMFSHICIWDSNRWPENLVFKNYIFFHLVG